MSVLSPGGHLTRSGYPGPFLPEGLPRGQHRSLGTPGVSRGRVRGTVCTCACPLVRLHQVSVRCGAGAQGCPSAVVTTSLGKGLTQGNLSYALCRAAVRAVGTLWHEASFVLLGDVYERAFVGEGEEWRTRVGLLECYSFLVHFVGNGGVSKIWEKHQQSLLEVTGTPEASRGHQALQESCGLQHPCRGAPSTFL